MTIQLFTFGTLLIGFLAYTAFAVPNWGWAPWGPYLKGLGFNRIAADFLIVIWLFGADLFLSRSQCVLKNDKKLFQRALWLIDFPALIGFLILTVFLWVKVVLPNQQGPDVERFVAGAAAMNLLVINAAFSVLLFWSSETNDAL